MTRNPIPVGAVFSHLARKFLPLFRSAVVLTVLLGCWPAAAAMGPLSVNHNNTRYFTDTNGAAVYLSGTESDNNFIDRSDKASLDFEAHLEILRRYNHNFLRLWNWEQATWIDGSSANVEFSPMPYERSGGGMALDGKPRFDLTRFNQEHFDRLRARVQAAAAKGIYVSVMLFHGTNSKKAGSSSTPWAGHPYRLENNINGVNGDPNGNQRGEEVHNLSVNEITALQEAYARKVVDTLNDLQNVIYEIRGDNPTESSQWIEYFVQFVKDYQASKPQQHPVGISYTYYGRNPAALFSSSADWVIVSGNTLNPPVTPGTKVVLSEMDAKLFRGRNGDYWPWISFVRGYNSIYKDLDPVNSAINENVRFAIGDTAAFAESMDLSSMTPDADSECKFCLSRSGIEYLVYAPRGSARINLPGISRNFIATWFNPVTGSIVAGSMVVGGGPVELKAPFRGAAILHLAVADLLQTQADSTAPSFTLANSGSISLSPGSSGTVTITATTLSSEAQRVSFSISGRPSRVSSSFSKEECKPTCSVVLTLKAAAKAKPGTYTIVVKAAGKRQELSTSFTLTIQSPLTGPAGGTVATPTITPKGGNFNGSVTVSMNSSTPGASIRYTKDGSTPTESSPLYSGPFTLAASALIKAKAFKVDFNPSAEASATFIILPQGSSFTLTWQDNSTDEAAFLVERKTGASGSYLQIASVAANSISYTDSNLTTGVLYCYRVRATNSAGSSSYSNEACAVAS